LALIRYAFVRFVPASLLLLLAACGQNERLEDFHTRGELRVATVADGLAYRNHEDGTQSGFEHDLLVDLGQRLKVPVRFVVYPNAAHALEAVINGHAHLAAAGLNRNADLPLKWTTAIRELDFVLAGQKDRRQIRRLADLAGRVVTARPGTQAAAAIDRIRSEVPTLEVVYLDADDQTLLTRLAAGQIDLLATDRVHFALAARVSPRLTVVHDLPHESEVVWALPPDNDGGLGREINAFLSDARESGLIERISDRYFGHVRRLDRQDVTAFLGHIEQRLPLYLPHFLDASARTGIDWRYLAALSYQESHWNPEAESRTGVRGLMMLTTDTANRLGIRNRLDPRQSILGGARYIAMLQNELPDEVPAPDRLWMATAAYNIGMGHFNGARSLARQLGKDDTSWLAMKSVLPLIARSQYRLKGSPRGHEALIMTENVRNYYDILTSYPPPAPVVLGEPSLGPRLHAQTDR
jgi:membrane-bound lytic murein transglycosylase F